MGKFSDYNVQLKGLADGEHRMSLHLSKQFFVDMENDEVRDANLDVEITVKVKGETYDLTMHVAGTLTVPCDRCLDDLVIPVDSDYHILVEYGDDYNADSDTLLVIPKQNASLNVAYMLYDTAVLAIPLKHVHPQGKCNKQMSAILRKHAGKGADADDFDMEVGDDDSATDPRWDALKGYDTDED